jgi:hypothetical protein
VEHPQGCALRRLRESPIRRRTADGVYPRLQIAGTRTPDNEAVEKSIAAKSCEAGSIMLMDGRPYRRVETYHAFLDKRLGALAEFRAGSVVRSRLVEQPLRTDAHVLLHAARWQEVC